MFARLARYSGVNGRWIMPTPVALAIPSNPRVDSPIRQCPQRRRPTLLCRWRPDPVSGRLVCGWKAESLDIAAAAAPRHRPPKMASSTTGGELRTISIGRDPR
jgi:hypothetical protein